MALIRKIALGLLLAASAAVLVMAALELWNYRQWAYLSLHEPSFTLNDRARILQDRMDLLTRRVGDMELLVLVLLGTSGLYAIVFVASSYFSATSFARQADRTIAHIRDEVGLAMGDLRELQEQTERKLQEAPASAVDYLATLRDQARAMIREEVGAAFRSSESWEAQVAGMAARIAAWRDPSLSEQAKLELVHYETAAAYLEMAGGPALGQSLAGLYRSFARLYNPGDPTRAKFYLDRALRLAPPESPLASEIHYDLACWLAGAQDFERAMRELASAFQHQSKDLDDRLAADIEEGGRLYQLASTPPFDKALNDLLLNMSIGMG
jgi:tetratricopeptide (TPR) repeat protein